MEYLTTYAQNQEDIYLASFFPDVEAGFYVDVGANHPVVHSVTKRFSLGGWRGINIEPIRRHHRALVLDRPNDINLQIGISNTPGNLTFREYTGDGLSTFSAKMKDLYAGDLASVHTEEYKEYTVEVHPLREVLSEHSAPQIHFMKVDVEGYEYQVLEGNNWAAFRPQVLCIEANHIIRDWHDLIADAGYQLAFFDGLNEYFVSTECAHRIEAFRNTYPRFPGGVPVMSHAIHEEWALREREAQLREAELAAAHERIRSLSRQVARLKARSAAAPETESRLSDVARALDRRLERRLLRWRTASQSDAREVLESHAFRPADPSEMLKAIRGADARVFDRAIGPSRSAELSLRSYRVVRRLPRRFRGFVRAARQRAKALAPAER